MKTKQPQNVGCVSGAKDSDQEKQCNHRLVHIQATLFDFRHGFCVLQFFDQSSQIFPRMREIAKYSAVAYFLDSLIAHDKNFSKRHFIISKAILCTTEASSIKHAQ